MAFVVFEQHVRRSTLNSYRGDSTNLIAWFDTWHGPIRYHLEEFLITASGDLAFVHGFVRIGGTKHDGQTSDVWARQTLTCTSSATPGRSSTSTPQYPSTWTTATWPPSTSNPKSVFEKGIPEAVLA
jgi:hypothetical protein